MAAPLFLHYYTVHTSTLNEKIDNQICSLMYQCLYTVRLHFKIRSSQGSFGVDRVFETFVYKASCSAQTPEYDETLLWCYDGRDLIPDWMVRSSGDNITAIHWSPVRPATYGRLLSPDSYLGPPSSLLIINDLLLPGSEQNIQLQNWFGPY